QQRQLVEAAVFVLRDEQPLERQQGGQERGYPQHAGADTREDVRLRPDAEWKQQCGQYVEDEHQHGIAALAQRQPQIATDEGEGSRHHFCSAAAAKSARARTAPATPGSPWLDSTMRPPPAR